MNLIVLIILAAVIFSLCRWAYWSHRLAVARRNVDAYRRTKYEPPLWRATPNKTVLHKKQISGTETFRASCPCGWSGPDTPDRSVAEKGWDEHVLL